MLEFVFNKNDLKELIDNDPGPDSGNVVVQLVFDPGRNKVFPARVIAFCEDITGQKLTDDEIDGCPRPPGCG